MGKIWAVCSGSGGVGKSTIALSLAVGAANAGKKTILLDASGISRSCDLTLGLESIVVLDMVDVIARQADIQAALYRVPRHEGLRFACASLHEGVPLSELSTIKPALCALCDVLVVDLPTGQLDLGLMRREDVRIVVTRPDDASMRAAERLMMNAEGREAGMYLAINRISRACVRAGTQYDVQTVETILDCPSLAAIAEDEAVMAAARKARAAIEGSGQVRAALNAMVNALLKMA